MALTYPNLPSRVYGWFDYAGQSKPTYDPGLETPCLYCNRQMTTEDVRTFNLTYVDGPYARNRTYFYRVHKSCDDKARASGQLQTNVDNIVLTAIKANGD